MAQRLNPAARDAALSRIAMITTGVVALGLAGTVGLGVAIAAETPVKKTPVSASYGEVVPAPVPAPVPAQKGKVAPAPQGKTAPPAKVAPAPKPKATQQAPVTTSGGS